MVIQSTSRQTDEETSPINLYTITCGKLRLPVAGPFHKTLRSSLNVASLNHSHRTPLILYYILDWIGSDELYGRWSHWHELIAFTKTSIRSSLSTFCCIKRRSFKVSHLGAWKQPFWDLNVQNAFETVFYEVSIR